MKDFPNIEKFLSSRLLGKNSPRDFRRVKYQNPPGWGRSIRARFEPGGHHAINADGVQRGFDVVTRLANLATDAIATARFPSSVCSDDLRGLKL